MADQKITQLTEDTDPALTDLLVTVADPSGSPVNRKATIANVLKSVTAGGTQMATDQAQEFVNAVGIGTATFPENTSLRVVTPTLTGSIAGRGVQSVLTYAGSYAATGMDISACFIGSNSQNHGVGLQNRVYMELDSGKSASNVYGTYSYVKNAGPGGASNVYANWAQVWDATAGQVVTSYGYFLATTQGSPAAKFGFYQEGDEPNSFGGALTLRAGNLRLGSNATIGRNTSDGADNGYLELAGGGAADITRGAYIDLFGNEHAYKGSFSFVAGLGDGSAGAGQILFYTGAGPTLRWTLDNSGNITQTGALGLTEMSAPTGVSNVGLLYTRDNGSGKTVLACKLGDNTEIILATQA